MGAYTNQDLELTDSGDLVIASDGDLSIASIDRTVRQDIILNAYTILGDFEIYPNMGSRIYRFIGEPNTRTNAGYLKTEFKRSLTQNGTFASSDLDLSVIPISAFAVAAYLNVINTSGLGSQRVVFNFNYTSGLKVVSEEDY